VFTEAGSFTLPPFQCRAGVYDPGARRSSSSFFDEFFGGVPQKTLTFSSKPTTVDIQPLPTEKRPADFAGLIGSITVEALAEMTEFSVGDPVLLNLTIRGAAAPAFIKIPNSILEKALSPAFRVTGDDPPIAKDGGALLQRTIRAVSPDTVSIPALEIAYFDPEKGEYLTASTKPIPVTVKSARKITLNDASFADAKPADDGALREEATEIKAAEAGRAPDRPLQELLKNHISPLDDGRSYAMYFAIPAALWLLLLAARFLPSLAAASPAKRRAKAAAAKCLAALDSFKPENSSAMEELNGAFQELMGAKFNMTPGTITYQDIARKAKHLPPHHLETIRKFLELCENARYAGNAVSLADIDSDLRRLIREL
ncbi:MAG: BatD family protein, partial [Victivallales bacterium]|nr:BatD family protein [Victivallales bacterium]